MNRVKNTCLFRLLFCPPITFLIGIGMGLIFHHLYLDHGLGWNWLAIGTVTNTILVGLLVYLNIKYISILKRNFKIKSDTYLREHLIRELDQLDDEMNKLVSILYNNTNTKNIFTFPTVNFKKDDNGIKYKNYSEFWLNIKQNMTYTHDYDLKKKLDDFFVIMQKYEEKDEEHADTYETGIINLKHETFRRHRHLEKEITRIKTELSKVTTEVV